MSNFIELLTENEVVEVAEGVNIPVISIQVDPFHP